MYGAIRRARARGSGRACLTVIASLSAPALLVVLPYLMGVDWQGIGLRFARLSLPHLLGLTLLWLGAWWSYAFVLAASMPGLTLGRAFVLNAANITFCNVLPFGFAAGTAATFPMVRAWGYRSMAILTSALVSGLWSVLARLALAAAALGALLPLGVLPGEDWARHGVMIVVSLAAIGTATVFALRSERPARTADRFLSRTTARLLPRSRASAATSEGALVEVRNTAVSVLRTGWRGLLAGMLGHFLLQAGLLAGCLAAMGAHVGPGETLAVFAVNRLLATVPLTPGGSGVTELGTAALLVSFGVPAAPAAAGTLLYSFYTYAIDIPVGALAWLGYALRRSRRRNGTSTASPPPPLPPSCPPPGRTRPPARRRDRSRAGASPVCHSSVAAGGRRRRRPTDTSAPRRWSRARRRRRQRPAVDPADAGAAAARPRRDPVRPSRCRAEA
ncbi:YbhN family protein [Nonomuraea sp. NPDC050783]|uniref:lysylphosphatidylglycerol synthase transmembrane domain-containing protein n=1 Tax=Nonomuraea sp. NPDC050783 TaxID=3154634 RepID=UPI0034675568